MRKPVPDTKYVLDRLYARYNRRELIRSDPLQFVYHYSKPADREVAAFLASALAYGRVGQIERSLSNLFERMGESPFEFVVNINRKKRRLLRDFRHRFTSGQDISDVLALFQIVFDRYGSIEKCFMSGYHVDDRNLIPASSKFCDRLLTTHSNLGGQVRRGLKFLLANPSDGSACKRLNLFLRWMIRDDEVDTGLWKSIEPAKLVVPADVHMGRLCKILHFYSQKTLSLSAAVAITDSFAKIEPADPVKYDFALSRIGIVDNCDGQYRSHCESCDLFAFCRYNTTQLENRAKTG